MTKSSKSPFKKGKLSKREKSGGGSKFLSIAADESVKFVPLVGLDDLIYADMHEYWSVRPAVFHACIGKDCPGCEIGNEPRFKGYMPVQTPDGESLIYAFTISIYNQLEQLEEALERSIKGLVIKISRKGAGKMTRYEVINMGKEVDVSEVEEVDVIGTVGEYDKKGIIKLLEKAGVSLEAGSYEDDINTKDFGEKSSSEKSSDESDKWGD